MYNQSEYSFKRTIISGNRITIPTVVMREWDLSNGDEIQVIFRKIPKHLQGIVL